ncbi:MAG: AAA family ATPase [Leptolyngbyaceae bacterium]|nr:AAA family ATPase [Leptolyngbyaceae bacterium]
MRIETLDIQNFRCFESFHLDLDPRCTILIGNNGSGKTAILDSLAIAAGSWFIEIGSSHLRPRSILKDEIRYVRFGKNGIPTLEPQIPVIVEAKGQIQHQSCQWVRQLNRLGGRTTYGDAKPIRDLAQQVQQQVIEGTDITLPLIAYYGTGRLWVQKKESTMRQEGLGSRTEAYVDALEPASNQKLFEAWMRWREQARIEAIAQQYDECRSLEGEIYAPVLTPHLDAVKNAVKTCIPECVDFRYNMNYQQLRIIMQDGRIIPFQMLSDGYRNFVGMVADIAWRCVQLNPHWGADAPQKTEGIVLIDEIDLHLHPSWQRQVLDNLLRTFENLQFVVTTHSPQVIASAQKEWMRLLIPGEEKALPTAAVQGRDSNSILRDIMGTSIRPQGMQAKLDGLLNLIEVGQTIEAREQVEQLRNQLGASDTTLLNLEWELHDAEVYGAAD